MPTSDRLADPAPAIMKTAMTGLAGQVSHGGDDLAGDVLGAGEERHDEHHGDRVDLLGRAEQERPDRGPDRGALVGQHLPGPQS